MGIISSLSDAVNTREDAFRLLVSILLGYPLAAIYRTFFYNKSSKIQHTFIIASGLLIYLLNCGIYIYHSLISIVFCWLIVKYLPGRKSSVALAHICFLGHLLIGYSYAETASYDITWTTPFCIMTLRFIGLVMDVYDGHRPKDKDKVKSEKMADAIMDVPSLMETAAYGLFFAGTLVGPQFPLRRFRSFVNGEYLDKNGQIRESSIMASIRRFSAGIFFAVIHQWGLIWVPDSFFTSPAFYDLPFIWKVIWNTIWFRAVMYRYVTVWLLTEGATILCGLAYNGKDSSGNDLWDGVRDIHIIKFELGSDYSSVIESFNCGTNTFTKNHIFKRLKWIGNKFYSHVITLFYLAVWHGYHLGYFLLFAFEMACMIAQEQLYSLICRIPSLENFLAQPLMRPICWLFGRITINTSMAFAFFTFGLVKKEVWILPLKSMYFYGYILYFIAWPITYQILNFLLKNKKHSKPSDFGAKNRQPKNNSHVKNGFVSQHNSHEELVPVNHQKQA